MVIVTLPAFALSDALSNFSCPPGSADSVRFEEAPPPELVVGFGACAAVVSLLEELLELLLLPPQPATASAASAAHSAADGRVNFMIGSSDFVG
jgi:hypothetical protein